MRILALFFALHAAALASQPWDKPAAKWSQDDRSALLTRSPWALQVNASLADPQDEIEAAPPGPPSVNPLPGQPRNEQRWNGEIGRNRMGHLPNVPVLVRWDSALPIREAEQTAAAPADAYIISISGIVPSGKYHSQGRTETTSSSRDNADPKNPEEVLEAFMQNSAIVQNGSADLHPTNVRLDGETGTVRIFFSRQNALDQGQKEVLFKTHFGGLNVRAKFRISAMKYQGKIEL